MTPYDLEANFFFCFFIYASLMYILETNDMCTSRVCPHEPLDPTWNEPSSTSGRIRGEGFLFYSEAGSSRNLHTSIYPAYTSCIGTKEGGLNACKHGKMRENAEGKIKLLGEDGKQPNGRSDSADKHDSARYILYTVVLCQSG